MFKPEFNILDIAKAIGVLCLIYFLLFKVPAMFDKYTDSKGVSETTIEQIARNVSRAVVVANNKEVKTMVKDLRAQNSAAMKAVDDLGDKVTGVGAVVGDIKQVVNTYVPSEYFKDEEGNRDLHTFLVHSSLETEDGGTMPIATVYYSPNIKDETDRVVTDSHKLAFKANVIEAISKDGQPTRTVEAWAENNWSLESKGKKYPIDLQITDWAITKPPKSFMWNPNLNISMLFEVDDFFPGLGVSLWSYGRTKKDVDWRFANVFLGATNDYEDLVVGITPASYNIGNHIPLVSNIFVGPFVGY